MTLSGNQLEQTFFPTFGANPFGLVVKPAGAACNLSCSYCYYIEKEERFGYGAAHMSDEVLEEFTRQYIGAQPPGAVVSFLWQGGEPCLMGLDFFKKALALQQKYADARTVENSFQTNGVLLNDAWCRFFRDNRFLVGISIDGPAEYHDPYRKTRSGKPSFDKVIRAIRLLTEHQVEFNTLTAVNELNSKHPLEIYRFLKSTGSRYMQFMPVVERQVSVVDNHRIQLVNNAFRGDAEVTPWSVKPEQYGQFMIRIFDEWLKNDVGEYFVMLFESTLANHMGIAPGICMYAPGCGHSGTLEHNGDVYPCDHYVFPQYFLGNIFRDSLSSMMNSTRQQVFGQDKFATLPGYCRECTYLNYCYGECPKKRFQYAPDGEYGLNYLCAGYRMFYEHVKPHLDGLGI